MDIEYNARAVSSVLVHGGCVFVHSGTFYPGQDPIVVD